jgi:FlaG/FlaF family flagellin (archaellin)
MRRSKRLSRAKRKGLSAVIVELLLIVIALVTTAVLGGFVFGTLNFYYGPAELAAQVASCSASNNSEVCQVTLTNIGANPASTLGCTMNVNGSRVQGIMTNGGVVPASGSLGNVGCTAHGSTVPSGTRVVGWISFTGGFSAYFTAISA